MDHSATRPPSPTHIGTLLREWRAARRMSQLDLALEAGLSARHLSCVETGKAQASRDTIGRLADTLAMPLRERNALMLAAGYAPSHPETALARPELAQIRQAIDCILRQQEPYPAILLNRHWDVQTTNRAAARVNRFLLGARAGTQRNLLRQMFDPQDLRSAIVNWEEVAGNLIRHMHRVVAGAPTDLVARALLDEVLAYPGVPAGWRVRQLDSAPQPLQTTILQRDGRQLRFFSTITTFGTPRDVTLDELHIECCFPMDEETAELCRELARQDQAPD
ncbi:helix-turn-helix domain-containing protein [Rugamonas rubra]|uniref:Transcriptional regulator, contains XRE-family HTH domain n=1 Tax=Rugamonas rubra TaxID=758825 RepID=A0A1I4UBL4_9BURK|nr:helix-turn-helix transcriptional regulator [Rugamonas rubra]SFM86093.1 Transcriptional regulator, contains XRE-family HTH domain [Rugamonas rubra]